MKKPQVHVTMEPDKLALLEDQAAAIGVSAPTLATVILSTVADVQPNKVFNALGSIPESYRRPTARKARIP